MCLEKGRMGCCGSHFCIVIYLKKPFSWAGDLTVDLDLLFLRPWGRGADSAGFVLCPRSWPWSPWQPLSRCGPLPWQRKNMLLVTSQLLGTGRTVKHFRVLWAQQHDTKPIKQNVACKCVKGNCLNWIYSTCLTGITPKTKLDEESVQLHLKCEGKHNVEMVEFSLRFMINDASYSNDHRCVTLTLVPEE